jgi:hypothetical protein
MGVFLFFMVMLVVGYSIDQRRAKAKELEREDLARRIAENIDRKNKEEPFYD